MIFPKTVDQILWNVYPLLKPLHWKASCQTVFKINHLLYSSFCIGLTKLSKPQIFHQQIEMSPTKKLDLMHVTSHSYFQISCKLSFKKNLFFFSLNVMKTQATGLIL